MIEPKWTERNPLRVCGGTVNDLILALELLRIDGYGDLPIAHTDIEAGLTWNGEVWIYDSRREFESGSAHGPVTVVIS